MKPVLLTSGEPAGIGPDICLTLAGYQYPLVVLGDKTVLKQRAKALNLSINFIDYKPGEMLSPTSNTLWVWSIPSAIPVVAGVLEEKNASYVLKMLMLAVNALKNAEFSALVTAPIHKEIINRLGVPFTGHTEFLAQHCNAKQVVMMLACDSMRVALVTTHLPLKDVAAHITESLVRSVIKEVHCALEKQFAIKNPLILVAGLNPHAGEGGYLGHEEIETIIPALQALKNEGINVCGPFPADTLFTGNNLSTADAFVAMYHDQGLPVLKFAGFGEAVNITLGLPFIRTSVDHGTALDLAASGKANAASLAKAVEMAITMIKSRNESD